MTTAPATVVFYNRLRVSAIAVLDSKICNVLRQYLKEGEVTVRDLPVHVVYYAISHVLKENNIPGPERELLIEHLRAVFPLDSCPIILVPLLHNSSIYRTRLIKGFAKADTLPDSFPRLLLVCYTISPQKSYTLLHAIIYVSNPCKFNYPKPKNPPLAPH